MPLGMAVAGDITLLDDSERSGKAAAVCTASAIVIGRNSPNQSAVPAGVATIEVADIHAAFTTLVRTFRPPRIRTFVGVSPQAHVSPQARVARMSIFTRRHGLPRRRDRFRYRDSRRRLHRPRLPHRPRCHNLSNTVLYENVLIGDRTLIHAAVIIGAYGFGYRMQEGRHVLTQQLVTSRSATMSKSARGPRLIAAPMARR